MEKEKLKTIDIKGKEYVLINERIRYFRETYEDGQILTEILSNENGVCLFKATVVINGKIVATGHAQEKEGSTFINKTSYIENAETSAIGRALGIAGIGIDTSIATYEEVKNAINNQNNDDEKKEEIKNIPLLSKQQSEIITKNKDTEIVKGALEYYKKTIEQLNIAEASTIIRKLLNKKEEKENE
jgi:hypothetical protein